MSIDLSSFSRPARNAAPRTTATAEGHTLTLQLRFKDNADAMAGALSLRKKFAASPNVQRAAVVAVDPAPLTITFE